MRIYIQSVYIVSLARLYGDMVLVQFVFDNTPAGLGSRVYYCKLLPIIA